jgi:hypothetical protein
MSFVDTKVKHEQQLAPQIDTKVKLEQPFATEIVSPRFDILLADDPRRRACVITVDGEPASLAKNLAVHTCRQ